VTAGTLTGLPDADLERWLTEMRKACALTGPAALAAVDLVIWSLREWDQGRAEMGNAVPGDDHNAPDAAARALADELDRAGEKP
jgi:hypothetical protein